MTRIFISHPFSDNPEWNRTNVDRICRHLLCCGYFPVSPLHLFAFVEQEDDEIRSEIMATSFDLIASCDELWVYGDSDGCNAEVDYARLIDIPVRCKHGIFDE